MRAVWILAFSLLLRSWNVTTSSFSTASTTSFSPVSTSIIVSADCDSCPGSLRAALETANQQAGPDTIRFELPNAGAFRIRPVTPLPPITDPGTVIEVGADQIGLIVLDGSSLEAGNGLVIRADVGIFGLTLENFPEAGLRIEGGVTATIGRPGNGNLIRNNGTANVQLLPGGQVLAGTIANNTILGGETGIAAGAGTYAFTIGGTTSGAANTIINHQTGIRLTGAAGIDILRNRIGTDISLFIPLGNAIGILAESGSTDIRIGNFLDGSNTLAFNQTAVQISGADTRSVQLSGNGMYCNAEAAIVLDGGNEGFTAPVITGGSVGRISGNATPGSRVELFIVDRRFCFGNALCQGAFFLGSLNVPATGQWSFTGAQIRESMEFTTTATDNAGNTSEFSNCFTVTCPEILTLLDTAICEDDFLLVGSDRYDRFNPVGETVLTGAAANGCDSTVQVTLRFLPGPTVELDTTICAGDGVRIGDTIFFAAGLHTYRFPLDNGCDSTVQLSIALRQPSFTSLEASLCEGDTLTFFDRVVTTSGFYDMLLPDRFGCDSIIRLEVTVNPIIEVEQTAFICAGSSMLFCGELFTEPGNYVCTLSTAAGCDSIVYRELVVLDTSVAILDTTLCRGETLRIGDQEFDRAGAYTIVLPAANGCDSTILLDLDLQEPLIIDALVNGDDGFNSGSIDITPLDTNYFFEWSSGATSEDLTDLAAGFYTLTITDAQGCTTQLEYEVEEKERLFDLPNAFTPDNDGINDFFNVLTDASGPTVKTFRIYNRWGKLLYDNQNPGLGWDGTYQGDPMPAGIYVYLIEVERRDGSLQAFKGNVTLIR